MASGCSPSREAPPPSFGWSLSPRSREDLFRRRGWPGRRVRAGACLAGPSRADIRGRAWRGARGYAAAAAGGG